MHKITAISFFLFAITWLFAPRLECQDKSSHPEPTQSKEPYYAEIKVTAIGFKQGDEKKIPREIDADVRINGARVGKTPFKDGLPEGTYEIVIASEYGQHKNVVHLTPGETRHINATLTIPLTKKELAAIRIAKQKEEMEKQQRLAAVWQEEQAAWQINAAPIEKKRKPLLAAGITTLVAGAGFLITGGVFMSYANKEEEKIRDWEDEYEQSDNPQDWLAANEADLQEMEDMRDLNTTLGIVFLSVGGASLVTGVVLLALLPKLPQKPTPPDGLQLSVRNLAPFVGRDAIGATWTMRF